MSMMERVDRRTCRIYRQRDFVAAVEGWVEGEEEKQLKEIVGQGLRDRSVNPYLQRIKKRISGWNCVAHPFIRLKSV